MGSAKVNGNAATLKKRKREKNDDLKSQKKPKHQGLGEPEEVDNGLVDARPVPSKQGDELVFRTRGKIEAPQWRVSKPMGGRMLDIDPIFSLDEQYLILTYNTSVQVYSTKDSLLVRRIPIPTTEPSETTDYTGATIVSTLLSKASPSLIWVVCSDGRIWKIDWTTGDGVDEPYVVSTKRVIDASVEHLRINDTPTEVIFVLEKKAKKTARIVAYTTEALASQTGKTLYTLENGPTLLRSALNGRLIVTAAGDSIHLGYLNVESRKIKSLDDIEYQFVSFEVDDIVTCLDIRSPQEDRKQKSGLFRPVELAVGFARGKILLFTDVLSNFPGREKHANRKIPRPRKYHWHRRAVHSVKWSQDGNYLISGGSETVLVMWQLDTERPDFLPHLSASIENIVVSPQGASYAVHLDDNSTMVLSTAELQPTVYVSGIQSVAFNEQRAKDSLVRRVGQHFDGLTSPLTAIQNPVDPSQMLLCVGNGHQATVADGTQSTPLLQVFNLSSFHNVAKQAIARTNPADVNITSQGYPIVEPRVTQLAFSHDGKWLASVDEWEIPERDAEVLVDGSKTASDIRDERREVYLKFWEIGSDANSLPSLQLVSRVNDSHQANFPETIFDLAADPVAWRFATVGGDRKVRLWTSRVRQRDGLVATDQGGQILRSWTCTQIVSLGDLQRHPHELAEELFDGQSRGLQSGALTFSEDGSLLIVALAGHSNALYIIDAQTGVILNKVHDLFKGQVRAVKALGSCIITLSEDLTVYDLVADELRYGFDLADISGVSLPLAHVAVNPISQTFALSVAVREDGKERVKRGASSSFAIFSLGSRQPQIENTIPHVITSLLPATASSGFVFVDSAAQLWSVSEGPETASVAQPLADINLDNEADETASVQPTATALDLVNGEDDAESDEEMGDAGQDDDEEMEDYDVHPSVIAPQQLDDIYGSAPAWAMPPVEDLFYQVTALLSK